MAPIGYMTNARIILRTALMRTAMVISFGLSFTSCWFSYKRKINFRNQTLRDREMFRRTKMFVRFSGTSDGVAMMNRLSDQLFGKSVNQRNDVSKLNYELILNFQTIQIAEWVFLLSDHAAHLCGPHTSRLGLYLNFWEIIARFNAYVFAIIYFWLGTSSIQFTQLVKMSNLGFFGRKMKRNETEAPPDFPLHRITAPVSLHYSTVDRMATTLDVKKLITKLTGTRNLHVQEIDSGEFNHIDFMWGRNAASVVYSDIIKFFLQNLT